MKLRLEGTPQECAQAAPRLAEVFDIVSVSDPYPNRGRSLLVRVYVEVRLGRERDVDQDDVDQDDATAPPRATISRAGRGCPPPDRHAGEPGAPPASNPGALRRSPGRRQPHLERDGWPISIAGVAQGQPTDQPH